MTINIPFYKFHGCGNDFAICDLSELPKDFLSSPERISAVCDRHYGIGSDGLIVVADTAIKPIDILMYNPDGSEMGMCGNGIRCVVRYLCMVGHENVSKFVFSVFGRKILCETSNQGRNVEVDMGCPEFGLSPQLVQIAEESVNGFSVFLGNPHFVTFVDEINNSFVNRMGPEIERHESFPNRTNVEFVRVIKRDLIEVLVWERGAGWTLACGSGACAAVLIGIKQGQLDSPCTVQLPGGKLEVHWDFNSKNASVFLLGPAQEVCSGKMFWT